MTIHRHQTTCPYCGRLNDCQSGDGMIEPDSLAICISCGEVGVFTESLTLRQLTNAEWLSLDARLRRNLAEARDHIRNNKGKTDA